MNKKLKIAIPVLVLVVAGAGYKMVLAPKPKPVVMKINGSLLALDPEFVINLAGGRYAKLSVAVLTKEAPVAHTGVAPELHQNSAVRAIITDDLTGVAADRLVTKAGRAELQEIIVKDIHKKTDEHILKIYFTDIAVQ